MRLASSTKLRAIGFYLLLVAFCCAPVWSVAYFVNQDGSAHLNSSFLMLEILKGNPVIRDLYELNSFSVPNSTGHWLMTLLLLFFSPFTVTKIVVTLTFAAFVGAAGWLRVKTVGTEGVKTAMLIGAALSFNWLWLVGFYNFLLGAACFVFAVGLIFDWREKMNARRATLLSLLLLLAYFSHIVSFAVLAGSAFLMLLTADSSKLKRNLTFFAAALLPVVPLALMYKSISASGGGFSPAWRSLADPWSPASWFAQLRTADPFILISRKCLPFIDGMSSVYAFAAPIVWILAALTLLAIATYRAKDRIELRKRSNIVFGLLFFGLVAVALFAPDDFGLSNGSVLRERILICGLIIAVPLFRADNFPTLKRTAQACLLFVIAFQTAALWEYAFKADREAREFLAVSEALAPDERIASILVIEDGSRFNSMPTTMMNNYLGVGTARIVWDNYELGHYLFPIVAKNQQDKRFIFDLTRSSALVLNNPKQNFEERLADLEACLAENHLKIQSLILWGEDARVEAVVDRWFAPAYAHGRARVFRHK